MHTLSKRTKYIIASVAALVIIACSTTGLYSLSLEGNLAVTGTTTLTGATTQTGDLTLNGGVGAITTTGSGDTSILVKDADTTALVIGADGALDIIGIDSSNAAPKVDITGINGQTALHVNVGNLVCDEASTFTGDAAFNGGASAIDVSASGDSSILVKDADTTAMVIGADGALDIIGIDSSNAAPKVDITGINGQTALHVNIGNLVCDEASTFTGDMTVNGGAGAITMTGSGDSSIVLVDADPTALVIGADGALNILGIDTSNAAPMVDITGVIGQVSAHVDAGTLLCDELAAFGAGANMDGDVTFAGGAGAVTFDAADASIVYTDAVATGLVMGSAGHLNLITLDSTNDQETLIVTGETAVDAFQVAVGTSQFDENADFGAGIDVTGALGVSTTSDLNGDISAGGGAGALTFDAADSSIVCTDNSATGLDVGAAGATSMIRLQTTNDQEAVEFRATEIRSPELYIAFNLGAGQGLMLMQSDGTAYDSTATTLNHIYYGRHILAANMVADAGNTVPAADAEGLDLTAGNVTDTDNVSYWTGTLGASGRPFVVGTDDAFKFCATIKFHDVTGSDSAFCGVRTADPATVAIANYTDYAAIGHVSGNVAVNDKTTGVTDCGTDVWADDATKTICTLVSAGGVVTYTLDGAPPNATDAHTLTDGALVVPFCQVLHDGDGADDTWLTVWSASYQ